MLSVIQTLQEDLVVRTAVKPADPPNRVTDGLMKRAAAEIFPILAQWRVNPTVEDIQFRTAEMAHVCAFLSGAAQNPKKVPSIDFFMMHSTNLSVFYPTLIGLEWLSLEKKARLLTWKGWMDMVMYAGCGCPELYPERITAYTPKCPGPWESIISRVTSYPDDGHTAKLIRALLNARDVSLSHLAKNNVEFPLKEADFLQIAHMTMDSVERMLEPEYRLPEKTKKMYVERLGVDEEVVRIVCRWVRWCGVEGAWEDVPDLDVDEVGKGKAKL